jgi:exonuclease VII large subunit
MLVCWRTNRAFGMPVTAKLSKAFYDRLGDEITNELVNWFNQVDADYRAELRELNDRNFARFEAKLDQRVAQVQANLERRLAASEKRLEGRMSRIEQRLTEVEADLRTEIRTGLASLRTELTSMKAELIKWMFLLWLGTMATTVTIVGVAL